MVERLAPLRRSVRTLLRSGAKRYKKIESALSNTGRQAKTCRPVTFPSFFAGNHGAARESSWARRPCCPEVSIAMIRFRCPCCRSAIVVCDQQSGGIDRHESAILELEGARRSPGK